MEVFEGLGEGLRTLHRVLWLLFSLEAGVGKGLLKGVWLCCWVVLVLEWNVLVGGMDCALYVFWEVVDCRLSIVGQLNIKFGFSVLPPCPRSN